MVEPSVVSWAGRLRIFSSHHHVDLKVPHSSWSSFTLALIYHHPSQRFLILTRENTCNNNKTILFLSMFLLLIGQTAPWVGPPPCSGLFLFMCDQFCVELQSWGRWNKSVGSADQFIDETPAVFDFGTLSRTLEPLSQFPERKHLFHFYFIWLKVDFLVSSLFDSRCASVTPCRSFSCRRNKGSRRVLLGELNGLFLIITGTLSGRLLKHVTTCSNQKPEAWGKLRRIRLCRTWPTPEIDGGHLLSWWTPFSSVFQRRCEHVFRGSLYRKPDSVINTGSPLFMLLLLPLFYILDALLQLLCDTFAPSKCSWISVLVCDTSEVWPAETGPPQ